MEKSGGLDITYKEPVKERMFYEVQTGTYIDFETKQEKPIVIHIITEEERRILEFFADTRKDADFNTVYRINANEFKIVPQFNIK